MAAVGRVRHVEGAIGAEREPVREVELRLCAVRVRLRVRARVRVEVARVRVRANLSTRPSAKPGLPARS